MNPFESYIDSWNVVLLDLINLSRISTINLYRVQSTIAYGMDEISDIYIKYYNPYNGICIIV